ncbi:GA4 desaturase [Xylogone sp. PMI_703]|nr:GA4 desaturase [Xylogone sp. PMI_703]
MSATETITQASTSTPAAQFSYYASDKPLEDDDPAILKGPFQTGKGENIGKLSTTVQNIRESNEKFNIDVHGFQVLNHNSSLLPPAQHDGAIDFHDVNLVKSIYWPEITALVKQSFGARGAAVVNTTLRDIIACGPETYDSKNPRKNPKAAMGPFFLVHGDYTPDGGRAHLRAINPEKFYNELGTTSYITPEERETFQSLRAEVLAAEDVAMQEAGVDAAHWDGSNYAGPRWAMFSIWRPLSTVHRSPLGIMDARDLTSFAALPRTYRDRPGFVPEYKCANMLPILPREQIHRWYWMPEQKPDEVYAIKLFDSEAAKRDGVAFAAAHSAFELEGTEDLPPRRSIELRVMAIW